MSNHSDTCKKTDPDCICNTCTKDRLECCSMECRHCPATNCKNYENEEEK